MSETEAQTRPVRVRRLKFDWWLFSAGMDNVEAARRLNCHPVTIGRYRKPFDDPSRPTPDAAFIRAAEQLTDGEVSFEDWFRPCDVAFVTEAVE
jgi:uncharacterized radical SAM superfamily Fe-S cluster-containing enzyme